MRRLIQIALALAAALCLSAAEIDPGRYLEDVKTLASDQMRGRGDGQPELDAAARYIAAQFQSIGLRPAAGDSFLQPFPIVASASLGENNRLEFTDGKARTNLKANVEFRPLSFSTSGNASGRVVFAGYGITAPEYGYDDYAGLDVKGKLVIVLRHEPQEFEEKSIFSGRVYTSHGQFEAKALNAKAHGAAGVLFVSDKPSHPSERLELGEFSSLPGPPPHGLPFVEVRSDVADDWLRLAGHSLEEVVKGIDKDLKPRSFALPASFAVDLTADVRQDVRDENNVAGYLPGKTGEYLIVGAHYDHIGLGEQFSMSNSGKGTVHPGADDNASGTAGVIELARWFAGQPKPRRGILFVAFAGEEIGLIGSNFLAENPLLPPGKAVAMINLDMIGRLRDRQVFVGGVDTGSGLRKLVEGENRQAGFRINDTDSGGYGSSDQFSFLPKEIPVLFFFTGHHSEYHTPNDTWDKIDGPATAKLVGFIGTVAERLVEDGAKPRFRRQRP